jgi:NAD+ diphosphatase
MPFLGPQPFFGQAQEVGTIVGEEVSNKVTESARHHSESLPVSFLGMYEKNEGDGLSVLPTSEFSSPSSAVDAIKRLGGIPYFAMDVADLISEGRYTEEELLKILQGDVGNMYHWSEPRALMIGLDQSTAGIFACARSLVDWNYRNKVSKPRFGQFSIYVDIYIYFSFVRVVDRGLILCGVVGNCLV